MPFVSSSIYHKAVNLAMKEGLNPELLSNPEHGNHLKSKEKYLPIQLLFEVYECADLYLEAGFSIRQGNQMTSDDYGTLGLAWKTCWLARDILLRTMRYMVLVTDQGAAHLVENNRYAGIILERDASRRGLEMANETTFVMMTRIIAEVTEKEIFPQKVTFQHASPDTALFEAYFQCPVQFTAPENAVFFHSKDLEIPTIKADKHIHEYLTERMEEEKRGISIQADNLLFDIQKLVKDSLPSGIPSIMQVAEHQGVSPRTLKRRLSEKGKTFRELIQSVQLEEALNLLKNSRQSISEIAFMTGFSEQSAFHRAFKRWTGQSPSDYRKTF
jgi:AraC-like DNA-binding protein